MNEVEAIAAETTREIVLKKVRSSVTVPVSKSLLENMNLELIADIIKEDIVVAMMSLYAPGSEHTVKHEVWVGEVPDGRWQMFKAALGLPHRTKDIYGPYTCIFKVCPHVDVPDRTTHFHWMADPPEES